MARSRLRLLRTRCCGAALFLAVPAAVRAQAVSPSSAGLARTALELTADLRDRTTLGAWLRRYPADSVQWNVAGDGDGFNSQWCAVLHGSTTLGRRDAYFYVPLPPSALTLPPAGAHLREQCQLGAVRLEAEWADSLRALRAWSSDSAELTRALGTAAATFIGAWVGEESGIHPLAWQGNELVGWMGVDRRRDRSVRTFAAVIALSSPTAELDEVVAPFFAPPLGGASIDTLIALAGLQGSEATTIRDYVSITLAKDSVDPSVDTARDTRFEQMLDHLVRPSPIVSPDHRIGRLLVADWLLDATTNRVVFWAANPSVQHKISQLGPRFAESQMDGWWHDHFWLSEAVAVGGDGPAWNVAFLDAMGRGFDFLSDCGRRHQVDDVIERGTAYLDSHPTSPIRAQVELMLAEAERDAVVLGDGGGPEAGEGGEQFMAIRDSLRGEAVMHFRSAFRVLAASPRARYDWQEAWRLDAGLKPAATQFDCADD